MSAESLFSLCSYVVLPSWALLIFAPRWKWTARMICALIVPVLLGVVYVALLASQWNQLEGGFRSLAEVAQLFSNPYALLAGWVHYLAFDLFIGSWEVRDAQRLNISHWLVTPCLLLTFLFGPFGLVLYLALRFALRRVVWVNDGHA
ncbi:MAG: ABA4-like family protein [Pirellulales bacterium]